MQSPQPCKLSEPSWTTSCRNPLLVVPHAAPPDPAPLIHDPSNPSKVSVASRVETESHICCRIQDSGFTRHRPWVQDLALGFRDFDPRCCNPQTLNEA